MVYRLLLIPSGPWHMNPKRINSRWERHGRRKPQRINGRIYTEILLLNKQISKEASYVLYSELLVVIEQGHILKGDQLLDSLADPETPPQLWRHNPHLGMGYTNDKNVQVYSTPEIEGKLEPHVFARFQNVELLVADVCIGLIYDAYVLERPDLFDFLLAEGPFDETLDLLTVEITFEPSRIEDLQVFLRHTNVFTDLVSVISGMARIRNLRISLDVIADPFLEPTDDIFSPEYDVYVSRLYHEADSITPQILVNSRIMDPLRGLTNVEELDFHPGKVLTAKKLETGDWQEWIDITVEPETEIMIDEIKSEMRANYLANLKPDQRHQDQNV